REIFGQNSGLRSLKSVAAASIRSAGMSESTSTTTCGTPLSYPAATDLHDLLYVRGCVATPRAALRANLWGAKMSVLRANRPSLGARTGFSFAKRRAGAAPQSAWPGPVQECSRGNWLDLGS